jgi:hypothetical protein
MKKALIAVLSICLFGLIISCKTKAKSDFKPGVSLESVYEGYWQVYDVKGGVLYLHLREDGKVFTTFGKIGEHGKWMIDGERARIELTNGWKAWIYKTKTGFKKMAYSPEDPASKKDTGQSIAIKFKKEQLPRSALKLFENQEKSLTSENEEKILPKEESIAEEIVLAEPPKEEPAKLEVVKEELPKEESIAAEIVKEETLTEEKTQEKQIVIEDSKLIEKEE